MSTQGLVYDSSNKIDKLLAHAFASDYNQTYLYKGKITSIAAEIAQGGARSAEVISKVSQGLRQYLTKYYTSVDVVVEQRNDITKANSVQITLGISLTVVENQAQISTYHFVTLENGSLMSIINASNNGVSHG
jgi:hypothetical protein